MADMPSYLRRCVPRSRAPLTVLILACLHALLGCDSSPRSSAGTRVGPSEKPSQATPDASSPDASSPDGSSPDATQGDACATLVRSLEQLDHVGSCEVDADCILIGAYSVGPGCPGALGCADAASDDDLAGGKRGVFVTADDEARAQALLQDARQKNCIPGECDFDGETFEAKCVSGQCAAAAVCCNCPPVPDAGP